MLLPGRNALLAVAGGCFGGCLVNFGLAFLDRQGDLFGGDGETLDPDAERVFDGVGHHRGDRDHRVLAPAPGAVGIRILKILNEASTINRPFR